MLENLINLIKENASTAIINNPAIPNEKNEEAIQATGNSIFSSLQNALSGGGLKNLVSMFGKGSTNNNPVVNQATGNLIDTLKKRFGLDHQQAAGVADNIVPNVMNQLAQKTADPNDNSFDAQNIFNQLSGGKTSGIDIQGILNQYRGRLDKDGDGDVDMQDVQSLFSGGGLILDKVKGMFN